MTQSNIGLVYSILASTLHSSVSLILASMGGYFSMWVGVSDLGLEGMVPTGSLFVVLGSWISGDAWIGPLTGILFDVVFFMLHVVMHISYKVNAFISGMCVNLLASAATLLLLNIIFGVSGRSVSVAAFAKLNWSILQKIPVIGRILRAQNILFFLTTLLVIISWVFLYKTTLGLRMGMVSGNPQTASTVSLNVRIYKYFGVAMNDTFAGLGGVYLSLGQINLPVRDIAPGKGYITVIIDASGRYNSVGTPGGSLLFGFSDSLQTIFQSIPPLQLVMIASYVFTLLVIIFGLKGGEALVGVGKHVET